MKITTQKEYYKAKFEYEELLEKIGETTINPDSSTPVLTSGEQSLMKTLEKAIEEYEEEEDKEEPVELDEFHWHEAGDRSEFVVSIIQILLEHSAIAQTDELKNKLEMAQGLVFEVYQEAILKANPTLDTGF